MERKRIMFAAAVMVLGMMSGCGRKEEAPAAEASVRTDSVIVVMNTESEPEAGFDPAYGWGAGEHVHEPLIQSTLTVTEPDLSIGYDLAEEVEL